MSDWLKPCCRRAYDASAERYVECPDCGTVVRNIDGLHKPRVVEGTLW
ncbi:MAG TPA: hypothetical protein VNQ48_00245 [Microbacteriaceae bacterium]|nr:hypothetical protein [Microbacteriaceae bacterium]